jgi:hypothetical protein
VTSRTTIDAHLDAASLRADAASSPLADLGPMSSGASGTVAGGTMAPADELGVHADDNARPSVAADRPTGFTDEDVDRLMASLFKGIGKGGPWWIT